MGELFWMAGKAFFVSLVLTPIIRDISRSFNVVDRPGNRKVHAYPVPRVGGVAIAIAYALSLLAISGIDRPLPASYSVGAWQIIPGAAIVFAVGLVDDLYSIHPVLKLSGLICAASVAFLGGLRMGDVAAHPLPLWVDYPLTVFWLVLASNALNLIDGLDGLCAGMGLLSSLALFAAAVIHSNFPLAYATFPLAGALAGFLVYNFNPATVFIGDSGALLVGFLLGGFGMYWTQKSATLVSMVVPLLALSIPLLDVSLSVLRRLIRRQPIFLGDRRHIHHRLLDQGLSPRKAVLVLYLVGALAAAFALLASSRLGGRYQGAVIVAFCVAAWVGVRKLRYSEFDLAGMLSFGAGKKDAPRQGGLEAIAAALGAASGPDAWWEALAREGAALGMTCLRWARPNGGREAILAAPASKGWSLRVPLGAAGELTVEGGFRPGAPPLDLAELTDLLGRTYPGVDRPSRPERGVSEGAA